MTENFDKIIENLEKQGLTVDDSVIIVGTGSNNTLQLHNGKSIIELLNDDECRTVLHCSIGQDEIGLINIDSCCPQSPSFNSGGMQRMIDALNNPPKNDNKTIISNGIRNPIRLTNLICHYGESITKILNDDECGVVLHGSIGKDEMVLIDIDSCCPGTSHLSIEGDKGLINVVDYQPTCNDKPKFCRSTEYPLRLDRIKGNYQKSYNASGRVSRFR